MGFLAKASALFVGLRVTACYHQALQVADLQKSSLLDARRDIRKAIRASAARIQIEDGFWEPAYAARSARSRPSIMPKFFTHGSFARSDDRRFGKECVSTCRSRGSRYY